MKKILQSIFIIGFSLGYSQNFIPAYQDRVNMVSSMNINNSLQEFVNLGVKTSGSTANSNAFTWLQNKYLSYGFTAAQISENAFTYAGNTTKNLIVTKTGTLYPNKFVIVCGHYDSINGVGANDNGSGTTAILEMARILKDIPTEYSIKFIHFTGEEQGLLGSQHYVNTVVNSTSPKMEIKLVFNLDQVGGRSGQANSTIICERDQDNIPSTNNSASATVTQELMNCVSLYSSLTPTLSYAYASDYMPFEDNNEVITGFYEHNGATNPFEHSSNDIIGNMDPAYLVNVTKAALGAVQHFAVATSAVMGTSEIKSSSVNDIEISPNPTSDFLHINSKGMKNFTFSMLNAEGRILIEEKNPSKVNVSFLSAGYYIAKISTGDETVSRKILIRK